MVLDDRYRLMVADGKLGTLAGYIVNLAVDGPLGASGSRLALPFDFAMLPYIARNHSWQAEELRFVTERVGDGHGYQILDIGANVGLFSRQLALKLSRLSRIICVEADTGNFACLCHNLAFLPPGLVRLHNVALSDKAGETLWYRDVENFGNFSLNVDAMRGRPHVAMKIIALEIRQFLDGPVGIDPAARVIWKSDTQGFDELIISLTPEEVWERVDLAIIELWRIAKPAFDRDIFARRVEAFPNRAIGHRAGVSVADILDYLSGDDQQFADLYLWR
jgi:FkbM family methyltransferase